MKITVQGLSVQGVSKYPRIADLNVIDLEEDFIGDAVVLFCSPTLEARDAFFIWCDKHDYLAEAEEAQPDE